MLHAGAALSRICFLGCELRRVYTFGRCVGNGAATSGRALPHRIPLVRLKCLSEKRLKEMAARLGGEPGAARRLDSPNRQM